MRNAIDKLATFPWADVSLADECFDVMRRDEQSDDNGSIVLGTFSERSFDDGTSGLIWRSVIEKRFTDDISDLLISEAAPNAVGRDDDTKIVNGDRPLRKVGVGDEEVGGVRGARTWMREWCTIAMGLEIFITQGAGHGNVTVKKSVNDDTACALDAGALGRIGAYMVAGELVGNGYSSKWWTGEQDGTRVSNVGAHKSIGVMNNATERGACINAML